MLLPLNGFHDNHLVCYSTDIFINVVSQSIVSMKYLLCVTLQLLLILLNCFNQLITCLYVSLITYIYFVNRFVVKLKK